MKTKKPELMPPPEIPKTEEGEQHINYGGSVSLADVVALTEEPVNEPPIKKEYVKSIANVKGAEGEADIRNFHNRLFTEKNAELLARCQQIKEQVSAEMAGILQHLAELSAVNKHTPRYQEVKRENVPWTPFARLQVALLALFSVLLLAVGINTTAQVLIASGIPGFEKPWRAYLFSLTPIGIAFGFKYIRSLLTEPHQRTRYTLAIWIAGLVCGILWAILFAQTFPGMTQSVGDIIREISLDPGNTNTSHGNLHGILLIIVSILAESLLAAGCWLTIENIVEKHAPSTRVSNPAYQKTQEDLNHWLKRKYQQEEVCGKIEGKINAVEEARQRFVEEAVALFHVARAATAQNKELRDLLQ